MTSFPFPLFIILRCWIMDLLHALTRYHYLQAKISFVLLFFFFGYPFELLSCRLSLCNQFGFLGGLSPSLLSSLYGRFVCSVIRIFIACMKPPPRVLVLLLLPLLYISYFFLYILRQNPGGLDCERFFPSLPPS